jgi:hypothetical protein
MTRLRLTAELHAQLRKHLFPGDGKEAVAVALCGRLTLSDAGILCVHQLHPIGHDQCKERTPDRVTWEPRLAHAVFERATAKSMAILKIHSHPTGYADFSVFDDRSDTNLFTSLHSWTDDGLPHASAVMLPDGEMFGRIFSRDGRFKSMDRISVVGDDISFFGRGDETRIDPSQLRTAQTFGDRTTALLGKLKIGVVGCSGTGSWVIEQLARLGVGELVLVDPDLVERKNLNRIVNSSGVDAYEHRLKVDALREAIMRHGTGTLVTTYATTLFDPSVARQLASCDVLFGCMDSVEGRDRLNRIATFYLVPYFDLGVRLDADGAGGISNVSGVVHSLLPGGSSLFSRGAYTAESLRADSLRRTNPEQYEEERKQGYIKGAKVDSPAVISVNGFCATMAVNEFLGRIHPFRGGHNSEYRWHQFDLKNAFWQQRPDGPPCEVLARYAGRGDMHPFLDSVTNV